MGQRTSTTLALCVVAVLALGDGVRYLIGYPAWGALCAVGAIVIVVALVQARVRVLALPRPLLALAVLMPLSAIWAISPPATLLGAAIQLASIATGLLLATIERDRMLALLHLVLQGVLAASLLFELVVAVAVGGRVYPLVPPPGADYSGDVPAAFAWSRGLLLDGGRIQGLPGNANLLAMLALVALVLACGLALAGRLRAWPAWIALPLVTIALTRSATVLAALAAVVAVALVLVAWRGLRAHRRALVVGIAGAAVAGALTLVLARDTVLALVGRDADLTGRLGIWSAVVDLWSTSPVVGVGWLGYWQPWVPPFDTLAIVDGVQYLQAHSVVLDVLMQLGVVGLVVWVALQVVAFVRAGRGLAAASGRDAALAAVPVLLLVALLVQGLAESRPLIELGFVLLVALAVGRTPVRERERASA
ncbi:O-antigen ligase family protein [Agrococcus jejuensis]|uniref:O-antigen ligase n=1 Tax=Agrococcus jejuensis TaxID=399736 RepID=A0A1G8FIX4_9MICO|nr:O-antigen ligase family protein [Agrococcus jejuensis]SDH81959.1 O-antigen ligase [Agrococcus jejuensis]